MVAATAGSHYNPRPRLPPSSLEPVPRTSFSPPAVSLCERCMASFSLIVCRGRGAESDLAEFADFTDRAECTPHCGSWSPFAWRKATKSRLSQGKGDQRCEAREPSRSVLDRCDGANDRPRGPV